MRRWLLGFGALASIACAGWCIAADRTTAPGPVAQQPYLVPIPAGQQITRLPPPQLQYPNSAQPPAAPSSRKVSFQPEEVPGRKEAPAKKVAEPNTYPIDLPTALQLADANNLQVAFAREQVNQAMAQVQAANVLWLPSLRGGTNYNMHEGAIQTVQGPQINTSRGAFYAGAGAGAVGAQSPSVPGIYANFSLADAIFKPLAARQFAVSRERAAAAETNDMLLQVGLAYFELLRAGEDVAITEAIRADAKQLADLTTSYAETGAGLRADANRLQTELAVRINDVLRASEGQRVASARLAQYLRLDPTVVLSPADPVVAPIQLVSLNAPLRMLVAEGLSQRPELAGNRALVAEAAARLRRETYAVLVPSIVMGASYGAMSSGLTSTFAPGTDRVDLDAIAYWEMRQLGFGDAAARRNAKSQLRQTQVQQMATMDLVAREIVEAHAQVQSRSQQIETARQGVAAAMASYRQNVDRIEQAKGLPIEVLQSTQALAQSRREYLRTVIDYNSAQLTLYRALGWPIKAPLGLQSGNGQ
jgi:outer membrane protein TolC